MVCHDLDSEMVKSDAWVRMDITMGKGDTLEITTDTGQKICARGVTKQKTANFWMLVGASGVVFGMMLARVL